MASESKSWKIELTRTAEKQIQRLDRVAQRTIVSFLREKLQPAGNPRPFGKPLRGDKGGGLCRYRVGNYRLICDNRDEQITAVVLRVGHRKDVYG